MSRPPITYVPHPSATPKAELDALASVYWFVLRRREAQCPEKTKRPPALVAPKTR